MAVEQELSLVAKKNMRDFIKTAFVKINEYQSVHSSRNGHYLILETYDGGYWQLAISMKFFDGEYSEEKGESNVIEG